jgi:hypothetical protein
MKRLLSTLGLAAGLLAASTTASAAVTTYIASLSGPAESPANTSPGLGMATLLIDDSAHTMHLDLAFAGLMGDTTTSHLHCCTAVAQTGTAAPATPEPGFAGFPINVRTGSYSTTLDLLDPASYNPAFVAASGGTAAAAQSALLTGLSQRTAYVNIHTSAVPAGEIRGFLIASAVPEPASAAMLLLGLATVGGVCYRRRNRSPAH